MRVTNVKRNRKAVKHLGWELAIADAYSRLKMAKDRVTRLREIIVRLTKMKESGQVWPGESST